MDERERLGEGSIQPMTTTTTEVTAGETQTIVAARRLRDTKTVFIGVGRPSTAAILARMVHNPELVLVYESGTIGAKPVHIPLSITDLGVLEPDPDTCELVLTQIHPGVEVDKAREETSWELRVADDLQTTDPPTAEELAKLRELLER